MKEFLVRKIMNPKWIVNSHGELGIRVFGINLWYYKWPEPMISEDGIGEPGSWWTYAEKREFGEVVKSIIR